MLLQGNESLCGDVPVSPPGQVSWPCLVCAQAAVDPRDCPAAPASALARSQPGREPSRHPHGFSIRCLLRFNQGTRETVVTANILLFVKDWKLKERRGGCFWSSNMVQKWGMSLRISDRQATVEIRVDLFWMCRTVPCVLSNR